MWCGERANCSSDQQSVETEMACEYRLGNATRILSFCFKAADQMKLVDVLMIVM